jgi:anti-sigma-K factor RskA
VGKVALLPAQPAPWDAANAANAAAAPGIASIAGAAVAIGLDLPTSPTSPVSRIPGSVNPGAGTISPIVFSAPDSGVHAVAVPTAPAGGQYQLWSRSADGTVSSLGVLAPTTSPVSVVTFERNSVEGMFMSLEPVGGSLQPTGPTVGSGQNPVLPGLGRP